MLTRLYYSLYIYVMNILSISATVVWWFLSCSWQCWYAIVVVVVVVERRRRRSSARSARSGRSGRSGSGVAPRAVKQSTPVVALRRFNIRQTAWHQVLLQLTAKSKTSDATSHQFYSMNQAYLCHCHIACKVAILISMTLMTLHAITWSTGSMPRRTTSRICLWRWCCKSCFKTQAALRKRSNFTPVNWAFTKSS